MLDRDVLLAMEPRDLQDLYRRGVPRPIPAGVARGTALVGRPGAWRKTFASLTHLLAWQGKTFAFSGRRLTNRVTPLRISAFPADVYVGKSRFDRQDCIVIDYSKTSTLARWIRDEIRSVAPSLYLGFAYWGERRLIAFSLYFGTDVIPEQSLTSAARQSLGQT
ncbi:MAG: hypothetical protein JO078_04620 [Candidatus Eremiobacteraeota bacterium]|nr:hypothetical protein [Candidatus Eremiobacteraeota bacterium]MBV9699391.1 hypothetical protein [Candidatus Eremiobacteraeota bacterium]